MRETVVKSTLSSFVSRWSQLEGGQERSNYSLFLTELCDVLDVPHPDPAGSSQEYNDYVFERRLERRLDDGTVETKRIDLYKRDCFILEAKQSRLRGGKKALVARQGDLFAPSVEAAPSVVADAFDSVMTSARRQAEGYAAMLPADHSYPPFVVTCDVGRTIELFADFSGHGRFYQQFPDANGFRISLDDLKNEGLRERLRAVWTDPWSLDPAKQSAKVTRAIAGDLASLSKALEGRGFEPKQVALFLMRCLFTMFVEDAALIRTGSFTAILDTCLGDPRRFPSEIADLWRRMDTGDYSPAIGEKLLRFNGKLFKQATALPLRRDEIQMLRDASRADWRELEPAIFGTLFEQALDPDERRKLGAHYTPRAYVERLVEATIIEPLMQDWVNAQNAALRELRGGSQSAALGEYVGFLARLSAVRVLDPACGTGNFLYVALRRMKQLEGEVLRQIADLGGPSAVDDVANLTVKPEQFFGLELNERAVQIAELVLWIGYLQWHLKTRTSPPREPVLGSSDHVRSGNAVLTWDDYPVQGIRRDATGKQVVVGGREAYIYPNARQPDWPAADFIVGNPPFVGGKDLRGRLDEGEAEALWGAHPGINPSADFVMYWWDRAADLLHTQEGRRLRRFGFVTTNSITQVFQRRVVEQRLSGEPPVSIVMAIPDHPWTRTSKDAAAVRIAMTVVEAGTRDGTLRRVVSESDLDSDEPKIAMSRVRGRINADLTVGTDVTKAKPLLANADVSSPGVKLHGDGFIVTREKATQLGLGTVPGLDAHIREYRNGKDLTARPRDVMVIDLFGLTEVEVRQRFGAVYEHLLARVKPERQKNSRPSYRNNWWVFGEPRSALRPALRHLDRYIATVETSKHRTFQFLPVNVLPDNMLVAIASNEAFHLGVLSSKAHVVWAMRSGGWLGIGNDPRYSKSRCFDPFPFPATSQSSNDEIADLAEELDRLRKQVLSENSDIALTALYNAIEAARSGNPPSPRNNDIQSRGRILTLKELHDRIDVAVVRAYGWSVDADESSILASLVDLNAQRATEERNGLVRWLRPDYQSQKQAPLLRGAERIEALPMATTPARRPTLPDDVREQVATVIAALPSSSTSFTFADISRQFRPREKATINQVLAALAADQGEISELPDGIHYVRTPRVA